MDEKGPPPLVIQLVYSKIVARAAIFVICKNYMSRVSARLAVRSETACFYVQS